MNAMGFMPIRLSRAQSSERRPTDNTCTYVLVSYGCMWATNRQKKDIGSQTPEIRLFAICPMGHIVASVIASVGWGATGSG